MVKIERITLEFTDGTKEDWNEFVFVGVRDVKPGERLEPPDGVAVLSAYTFTELDPVTGIVVIREVLSQLISLSDALINEAKLNQIVDYSGGSN